MLEQAKRKIQRPSRSAILLLALVGVLLAGGLAYGDPAQVRSAGDSSPGGGHDVSVTGPPAPPEDGSRWGAPPAPPSSLYGYVVLNGQVLAEGTAVEAIIDSTTVASTETVLYQGRSFYAMDVPADDPDTAEIEGGRQGDLVRLKVAGLSATRMVRWQGGTNQEVNLDVRSPWPSGLYLPVVSCDRAVAAGASGP